METALIAVENVVGAYRAGGATMLPILLCGAVGFFFLYAAWLRFGADFLRSESPAFLAEMNEALRAGNRRAARNALRARKGLVARELRRALDVSARGGAALEADVPVRLLKTKSYLRKGIRVVSVMAAAAPLLGLLGTVAGMTATFESITLYGNSNPALMADGISEALITTQSGLLVACPLAILKGRFETRVDDVLLQLETGLSMIRNNVPGASDGRD